MTSAAPTPLAGRLNTLVIDGRVEGDRAVLAPRGELVRGCTDALVRTLDGLPPGTGRVDLDMARVTFMDTAGLEFLDVLFDHSRRTLVRVTATGWTGQPRRVLELAGLDTTDPLRPIADGPEPGPRTASAVSLERAEQLSQLQQEIEQLRHAIVSRPVIDQARGILMAAHGCTSRQAWDMLVETSQLSNTKLRTVAAAVTAGAQADGPPPPEEIRTALRTAVARHTR